MPEQNSSTNIALSIALVFVALLAGYVIFGVVGTDAPDGTATATVAVPSSPVDVATDDEALDVVFVIDATSSMADEIEQVKEEVVTLSNEVSKDHPGSQIRFGLVLFKDTTDDFLVKKTELTKDAQMIRQLLREIEVSGGGDYPEHVGAGLHEALSLDWNDEARRLIYLVGDAPSQNHNDGKDVTSAVAAALQQKIEIRTLGCSGIDAQGGKGKREFTEIAKATGGTYNDLTYHAVIVGQDGQKRSVIYEGGSTYEADRVLADEEWTKGSTDLKTRGLVKPAAAESKRKADSRPKKSNAIEVIKGGL